MARVSTREDLPSEMPSPLAPSVATTRSSGRRARLGLRLALLAFALGVGPAAAEDVMAVLSTDRISIDSGFEGTKITLFGAVERDAATVARPKGYDIVVVVRGPAQTVTTWRKERVIGIWVNRGARSFAEVPSYYAVLSSERLDQITIAEARRQLQLGIEQIRVHVPARDAPAGAENFGEAFRRLKRESALYVEDPGGVTMLNSSLFKADIPIPANVPTGRLNVDVHVFADAALLRTRSLSLRVAKAGFEQAVFQASTEAPLLYGLLTAALALLSGWVASVLFRRD
jgi:uncharacterized protein (TIGR02186 family)